ncbi:unnamed protein product, partial [Prorocentrum cordatum]
MSSYNEGFCAVEWMVKVKNGFIDGFIDEEQRGQKKVRFAESAPGDVDLPQRSLRGRAVGQPVCWAVKDASCGMRGYVIGPSSGCAEDCLIASFKGKGALAEAPSGCEVGVEPQLPGHVAGSTVHFAAKKRRRLGPRKGKVIFDMKVIVIGQSAAFMEPSLLAMFNGESYRVSTRPDTLSDADERCDEVENPSLKMFDIDDLPRAAAKTRRPAASYAFPEIAPPARLFFAALVYAICGPI